jgi:hypothetical protein
MANDAKCRVFERGAAGAIDKLQAAGGRNGGSRCLGVEKSAMLLSRVTKREGASAGRIISSLRARAIGLRSFLSCAPLSSLLSFL